MAIRDLLVIVRLVDAEQLLQDLLKQAVAEHSYTATTVAHDNPALTKYLYKKTMAQIIKHTEETHLHRLQQCEAEFQKQIMSEVERYQELVQEKDVQQQR